MITTTPFDLVQAIHFASGRGQKARKEKQNVENLSNAPSNPELAKAPPPPEFSRPHTLQQLRKGRTITLNLQPDEAKGLCIRFDVHDIEAMSVSITSMTLPGQYDRVKSAYLFVL